MQVQVFFGYGGGPWGRYYRVSVSAVAGFDKEESPQKSARNVCTVRCTRSKCLPSPCRVGLAAPGLGGEEGIGQPTKSGQGILGGARPDVNLNNNVKSSKMPLTSTKSSAEKPP